MAKVLLVAPTIDRNDVGEAWVAFQWADHLAARHDLTVLTYRKRGHPSVAEQVPGARVVEWLEPPLFGRAERLNSLLKPAYFAFARRARHWIQGAHARGERFDIAHQPVPVAMRYPSPLAGGPVPYIIGPVGGSLRAPAEFSAEDTAPWFVRLRGLDAFRLQRDPFLRRTYETAACVLGIAPYVEDLLAGLQIRRFECLSETALTALPPPVSRGDERPVRLLFVGRVIRTKGARDLVAAIARVERNLVTADVVGSGFDLENCRRLANDLGVSDLVTFHGGLPRRDVDRFYESADVFVFPSYREPGGNVVFEAMGYGLPLIVCDRGGPGAAVDSACAIRVPVTTPGQLADDIATAITTLAADSALRKRMGQAARERVKQVGLWSSKITRIEQIYDEIAGSAARERRPP